MSRTAEFMPSDTVSLAYLGFRPEKEKMITLKSRFETAQSGQSDTVVLDLFSNVAFMGTDGDGLPAPAFMADDGSYHVIGTLTYLFLFDSWPPSVQVGLWWKHLVSSCPCVLAGMSTRLLQARLNSLHVVYGTIHLFKRLLAFFISSV
jgi:hypothetical protein